MEKGQFGIGRGAMTIKRRTRVLGRHANRHVLGIPLSC
jgi:hypothetical protein